MKNTMKRKSVVAVLKTSPEKVIEDYHKLLSMLGYKKRLFNGADTLIKINLSWSLFYPACSTPPWQLEGVIKALIDDGLPREKIIPCENRTVVTNVIKGCKENKWFPIFRKYKVKFVPLTDVEWIKYEPKGEILALDKIFPDGHRIPKFFIGKNVVHLPTIKTHGHTTMTGAMKDAFGGLITERRHHCHKMIHEVLVDLLQIQKEIHPEILAVMDGTVCGDGAGPRTMIPKIKGYILASFDQVAIDAVSAKMMGYDPMKIRFIKLAHDKGLGCGDVDQIKIVGEDISNVNFRFRTYKSPVIFGDQLFRKGLFRFVEPVLFHTGLFNLCIFGSAFYHDYLWYPLIGRKRIKKFLKTEWGKLWLSYEK